MAYGKDEKKDVTELAEDIKQKLDDGEIEDSPYEQAVDLPEGAQHKNPDGSDINEKPKALTTSVFDRDRDKSFVQRNRYWQTKGTFYFDLYGQKVIQLDYNLDQFQVPNPKDMLSNDIDPNQIFNPVTSLVILDDYPTNPDGMYTWKVGVETDQSWFEGMSTENGSLIRGANSDFEIGSEQFGGKHDVEGLTLCLSKRFLDEFVLYLEMEVDAVLGMYFSDSFGGCVEGEINKLIDLVQHPSADDTLYKIQPASMDIENIKSVDRASVHYYSNVNFELYRNNSEYKQLESDQYVLED